MDFLMEYNITSEEINEIEKNNDKNILKNIMLCKNSNVREIMNYLIELGISTEAIKNLFIYQIGIFYKTKDELAQAFDEYEIDSIVKSLNYDVNTFDMIEFN